MNFRHAILAVAATATMWGAFSGQAQAQDSGSASSFSLWVWYVERDATHLGGSQWTATYGPYATEEEALAVKEQLDQNRFQGTTGFSVARVYSALNPNLISPMRLVYRNLIPRVPGLYTRR